MVRSALILFWALSFAGCRVHTLEDGHYTFAATRVLRDECGLSTAPGYVSGGQLTTTGDRVRLDYDAFGLEAKGEYLDPQFRKADRIELDGSASNVRTAIAANDCSIDLLTLHLEMTDVDQSHATGTLIFKTDLPRPEACLCQLWVEFSASTP